VELVVHLERWDETREYDRLGIDVTTTDILGIAVPLVVMPVGPGRNVAMLVEVAARNQLLRSRGRHAARELADRLERRLAELAERDPDDALEAEDL
jgi:HPr kinase/phosphorylase